MMIASFDADPLAGAFRQSLQGDLACEQLEKRIPADDSRRRQGTLAVADQLFPGIQMFGCHADVDDVDIRAADLHILQFGICAVGCWVTGFHHFARANSIINIIPGLHGGIHQPIHHFTFEGGNIRRDKQERIRSFYSTQGICSHLQQCWQAYVPDWRCNAGASCKSARSLA